MFADAMFVDTMFADTMAAEASAMTMLLRLCRPAAWLSQQ
jgi:hypothetical protein